MRPALIACAMLMTTSASAQKPPANACAKPERAQLDFWVGNWDVYPTGTTKLVAHSRIEVSQDGGKSRSPSFNFTYKPSAS